MTDMDGALGQLVVAIRDTKEYRNYVREKEKVKRMPELKARIDEFRTRNYEMQNLTEDDQLFDKMEEFEREYSKFRENPFVDSFLAAELAFCRMMQDINLKLTDALDFE